VLAALYSGSGLAASRIPTHARDVTTLTAIDFPDAPA